MWESSPGAPTLFRHCVGGLPIRAVACQQDQQEELAARYGSIFGYNPIP